jgi:hypothetical protein
MKIRALKCIAGLNVTYKRGTEFVCSNSEGRRLIDQGHAEGIVEEFPEVEIPVSIISADTVKTKKYKRNNK